MIFTRIEIDNLYCFKGSVLDLTFPLQPQDTTIPYEFIPDRPKFYYKRVCILSGGNASGKTALGKVMCSFHHLLAKGKLLEDYITNAITNNKEKAKINIEFITENLKIHSIDISILPNDSGSDVVYASRKIGINDSSAKARKNLKEVLEKGYKNPIIGTTYLRFNTESTRNESLKEERKFREAMKEINCSWHYLFSENNETSIVLDIEKLNVELFSNILKTFDPSIEKVIESRDDSGSNGYSLIFSNEDKLHIDLQGIPSNKERLSKGTYDSIKLTNFIDGLISGKYRTFYLDEALAFSHSELEQAIINLIIEKLPKNAQFFYTTHNYDILDLNLPIHSYTFLKKHNCNVEFIDPKNSFKKNDRKLLNYVKNDVFGVVPDTSLLDDLLWAN